MNNLMKNKKWLLLITLFLMTFSVKAEEAVSFFPDQDLPQFIASNFDLNTIRSSFGPKNVNGKRNFLTDFYPNPTYLSDGFEVNSEGWFYKLQVIEEKDFNKDGIIDIGVCFWDDSVDGTYNMSQPYLLTRYSKESPAIALSFQIFLKNCPDTSEKE